MSTSKNSGYVQAVVDEQTRVSESMEYAQQLASPTAFNDARRSDGAESIRRLSGPEVAGRGGATFGLQRAVEMGPALAGKVKSRRDARKFVHDDTGISQGAVRFSVTRDDRMDVSHARDTLERVRISLGIKRGVVHDSVVASFDAALWFCHTVNGASRLNPGRSKFSAPGLTEEFDYLDVLDMLGTDARRFFRTFADDIVEVNKRVLAEYDPYDYESVDKYSWLMEVAVGKGLVQYPYLAHDSADACLRLTLPERDALARSKLLVLSNVTNVADQIQSNCRFKS